jgi:type IV secretory pathway VirB2 component (pilin)
VSGRNIYRRTSVLGNNNPLMWLCLLQLITQYFTAGDRAGVAMSVTAGNTVLYRWWQLTWQCLLQLVTQLVIAFEAADETKSVVTSATNYVSCFLSKLSQLMCQCKSPAQRVRREWHCSYHSAMTLLVTLLVPQRNDIGRTTAQWHCSYHSACTPSYCNQQKSKICVNWDFHRITNKG